MKKLKVVAIAITVLTLSLVTLLSACTTPAPPSEAKILKIGQIIEMSGPFAPGLELVKQGTEVCAEWINDNGGIDVAGQKYKVQLIVEDNKSTPEGSVAAANKLIYQDNVSFIIGPAIPFLGMAMANISEEAKMVRVESVGVGAPGELGPETSYTFCPMSTVSMIGPAYDYLTEAYPKAKKIALVCPEDPSGLYWMDTSKKWAEKHGLTVVFAESYPVGTADFFPLCTRLWDAKPDAIELGLGPEPWKAGIIKGARQLGFTGPLFSGDTLEPNVITALAGKDAVYDMFTVCVNPTSNDYTPVAQEIKKRVDAKYPGSYQDRHTGGWAALWMPAQAIEKAQSLDSTKVRDTFENMTNFQTIFGTANMGGLKTFGVNNVVMAPRPLIKVDHGNITDIKIVTPRFFEDE